MSKIHLLRNENDQDHFQGNEADKIDNMAHFSRRHEDDVALNLHG